MLSLRQQALYWGAAAVVFCLLLWFLGNVLAPFIVAGALAYLLDPLATRLERLGMSRLIASSLTMLGAFLLIALLFVALVPLFLQQGGALIKTAPQLLQGVQEFIAGRFPELGGAHTSAMRIALDDLTALAQSKGDVLLRGLLSSASSVLSVVVFVVIVPVVAFYMLVDWPRMMRAVDDMIPRDYLLVVRRLLREVDAVLAGFLRGQMSVCLILGTYYAFALIVAGLEFGFVIGALAGAVTFIPYVGALFGGVLAIGFALLQFWGDWLHVAGIAAIFFFGQFAEGNIITPRLVGQSVALHPLWLFLALAVFGALFGFVGMLVAVPVAASLGVLVRFGVAQYRSGALFLGQSQTEAPPPPKQPPERLP